MNRDRRSGLICLTTGVILVGVAYAATWAAAAPQLAAWAMVIGIALQIAGITVVGGTRSNRPNHLVLIAALFLGTVIVVGFGAALLLPPESASAGPYLLGLPRRAAIVLLGVGILPFLVLPFLYAADFDTDGLDEASLARFREECRVLRESGTEGGAR
ncbi:MAG: hypothetical protein ABIZ70_09775 [Gemmatimonadales bacterium]